MEFFRNPNINFLSKKWYFIAFSLVFSVAGILSMVFWHGIPLGIDFRGGTLVYVKYSHTPDDNAVRAQMDRAGLHNVRIQRFGTIANNEILIDLPLQETTEQALDQGKNQIINALQTNVPERQARPQQHQRIVAIGVLNAKRPATSGHRRATALLRNRPSIVNFRDKTKGGVLANFDELKGVAEPAVLSSIQQDFFLSDFGVYQVEIVGPQVGAQLRRQAILATLYSLAGMLIYLAFRFEFIYGVAAVITVFHDTLITVGAFSLTNKPISLTVIAAILTLIGYSNNDTIVVFDRIRENLKLMRREKLSDVVNRSINQTLSRTILTAGLTFLTVLALYLFGGEVLHGFSFALVIGILIGTYSSIAIAAPILVAYQDWRSGRDKPSAMLPAGGGRREKVRAKA